MKETDMSQRYRKFKRTWGTYYAYDNVTGNSVNHRHAPNTPRRTTAAAPATPLCFATGGGGACGSSLGIQPAHRWRDLEHGITIPTSNGARPRSRFAPSNMPC